MVGTTLSQQLNNYIQSLHDQGILDEHFDRLMRMQDEGNDRQFIMTVISIFFNDANNGIAQITRHLINAPVPDYERTIDFAHLIRGSSSSLGGQRLAMACRDLKEACLTRQKPRCLELFERVKHEFNILRDCLNNIYQLERTILTNEIKRRRQP